MADLTNSTGGKTFLGVSDGKIVQRVQEGTEGAQPRTLKAGKNEGSVVYEKTYSAVTGFITGGSIEVKIFGGKKVKEIQVVIDDDTVLQLPLSMFLQAFAKPLPNLDVKQAVEISVYKNKKGYAAMNMKQGTENLKWAYTRENPNGLPEVTQDAVGNWDFRDADTFLELKVIEFFAALEGANTEAPQGYTEEGILPQEPVQQPLIDDNQDIPF